MSVLNEKDLLRNLNALADDNLIRILLLILEKDHADVVNRIINDKPDLLLRSQGELIYIEKLKKYLLNREKRLLILENMNNAPY